MKLEFDRDEIEAILLAKVRNAYGIELDSVRWECSYSNVYSATLSKKPEEKPSTPAEDADRQVQEAQA